MYTVLLLPLDVPMLSSGAAGGTSDSDRERIHEHKRLVSQCQFEQSFVRADSNSAWSDGSNSVTMFHSANSVISIGLRR